MIATTVKLSDVTESIDYGVTASSAENPIGPKFLRITDIQDDTVDWGAVPYCAETSKGVEQSVLRSGDIVFARTGATTGKSYLIDQCPDRAVFASYLIRVRPSPKVMPSYLAHFFRTPDYWQQITLQAAGVAQPGVNATKLGGLNVPLLPLDEQRRIAAILDQADELRRKRQRALDRLGQFGQAIFREMFGNVATNSKNWPIGTIGELTESTQYGTSSKAGSEGAFPILRMGNITADGSLDLSDLKRIDLPAKDVAKYTVKRGDLLFNRTNSPDLVGKTCVFDSDESFAFAGYLVRLRANKSADTAFISAFLNSPYGKKTLRGMCKAIIGMANINANELKKIAIPKPPVDLQLEYRRRVAALSIERSKGMKHRVVADSLFASLQHRAFRGEL